MIQMALKGFQSLRLRYRMREPITEDSSDLLQASLKFPHVPNGRLI